MSRDNIFELNLPTEDNRVYIPPVPTYPGEVSPQIDQHAVRNNLLIGTAALVTLGSALTLNSHLEKNEPNNNIVPDTSISSITLGDEARLRDSPDVQNMPLNIADTVDSSDSVVIETPNGVRIKSNTEDGTWYGINSEDFASSIPDLAHLSDDNTIYWVNEQLSNPNRDTSVSQ